MKPFRFGVMAESARTGGELLETARRAEDAGFSTLLIRDHLVEGPFAHQFAPLTSLAAVAAATSRLRVGTLVLCNEFRHPAVLAKELATIDVFSQGRLEIGLGAGFLQREFEEAGLPFDPPRERVGRLEESIRLLKAMFGDDPVSFHGRHYDVEGLDSFPKPVQRPHPPIQVAAAQPRMLGIAAREADVVGLQAVSTVRGVVTDEPAARSADTVARQVERVREAAGDRFERLELSTTATILLTDRPREAAGRLARDRGWSGAGAGDVLAMPSVLAGPPSRVVELLHERREAFGLSYYVLTDRALEAAGPQLGQLVSRAER